MLECVVNVSEGRRRDVIERISSAARDALLDVHADPDHNRAVLTLAGDDVEGAARAVASAAVDEIDLRSHAGVHPRLGAVDVVPFVPLGDATLDDAIRARDGFAAWFAAERRVPCFLYGPERDLPGVRRDAFGALAPDCGPAVPHVTAGATCVGARPMLVAYNLWIDGDASVLAAARAAAAAVRSSRVRALGLMVGGRVQLSMNLVDPLAFGPADAWDAVAELVPVTGAELVGLVPAAVVDRVPAGRRAQLGVDGERTIEARLAARRGEGGGA